MADSHATEARPGGAGATTGIRPAIFSRQARCYFISGQVTWAWLRNGELRERYGGKLSRYPLTRCATERDVHAALDTVARHEAALTGADPADYAAILAALAAETVA